MKRSPALLVAIPLVLTALMTVGTVLVRVRTLAGELAAEAHIRTIHAEQSQFRDQFGRYARSLGELAVPANTEGYTFVLLPTQTGYAINASPRIYGSTGRRTFYSDQTRTIRQNWSSTPADSRSTELK